MICIYYEIIENHSVGEIKNLCSQRKVKVLFQDDTEEMMFRNYLLHVLERQAFTEEIVDSRYFNGHYQCV